MEYKHETIVADEKIPLRIIAHEEVNGNRHVNKHWHKSIELIFCTQGKITCFINARQFEIREDELLIVNSNEIHSLYSKSDDKGIILQLPLEYFLSLYKENQNLYFSLNQVEKKEALMKIKALMLGMMRLKKEKNRGYDLRIHSLLYEMEYILIEHFLIKEEQCKTKINTHKYLDRLSNITTYLQENFQNDICLVDLAEHFSLAPQYLSRFFHKYANISFSDYLNGIRLDHAYKDLLNTDDSISTISMNNGFSNPRSFAESFRNVYGVTPSEYKKMNRKNI